MIGQLLNANWNRMAEISRSWKAEDREEMRLRTSVQRDFACGVPQEQVIEALLILDKMFHKPMKGFHSSPEVCDLTNQNSLGKTSPRCSFSSCVGQESSVQEELR